MHISRNIANGPKSDNYVLMSIWVIICIQKPSHHFLQTFQPLRMFKIVFRNSSLYPKQLCLFYLLCLISACADRIGCITNFCSMIKCCTSSKTALFNIKVFRHWIMFQQRKTTTKNLLEFYA